MTQVVNDWVTSDTHFFHQNVIKYCPDSRPFDDKHQMNEELIRRWNSKVKPNDNIYHLGDFGFGKSYQHESILEQLNGNKYFIFGNHDASMRNPHISKHFVWMKEYAEIKVDGHNICLFHFPITEWNRSHYGAFHFHGHLHSNRVYGRSMDVGVDSNDCYPHNIRDLIKLLRQNEIVSVYH